MHNWAMEAKIGKRIAKTKLALTKCPSGDFMSRMNRLSGGPS